MSVKKKAKKPLVNTDKKQSVKKSEAPDIADDQERTGQAWEKGTSVAGAPDESEQEETESDDDE